MKTSECPYEKIDCTEIDTSEKTFLTPCNECSHYGNGVRSTGATPVLAWLIEKINKVYNKYV